MLNEYVKFRGDTPSKIQSHKRYCTFGDGRFCVQLCKESLDKGANSVAHNHDQLFLLSYLGSFRR